MKLIIASLIGAFIGASIGRTVAALVSAAEKRDICMEEKTEDKE